MFVYTCLVFIRQGNRSYSMSENTIPHALNSFLSDLVEIRESKGITLNDIRVRTKVYPHIIAQFEADGLSDHPLFNVLYLKAFVRSYAEVVGISPSIAANSYQSALSGNYDRRLAIEYLGYQSQAAISGRDRESENVKGEGRSIHESAKGSPEVEQITREPPKLSFGKGINDSTQEFFANISNRSANIAQYLGERGILQWSVMGACLILGAYLLFKLVSGQNESMAPDISQEPGQSIQETAVTEGVEEDTIDHEVDSLVKQRENQVQLVIERILGGDSLNIKVIAASGKLDPFRARVDRDLRRPYWLEEGDSLDFWFSDQITVEDNLDKMVIVFEGVDYPIAETDSASKVVINRENARVFMYSSLQ